MPLSKAKSDRTFLMSKKKFKSDGDTASIGNKSAGSSRSFLWRRHKKDDDDDVLDKGRRKRFSFRRKKTKDDAASLPPSQELKQIRVDDWVRQGNNKPEQAPDAAKSTLEGEAAATDSTAVKVVLDGTTTPPIKEEEEPVVESTDNETPDNETPVLDTAQKEKTVALPDPETSNTNAKSSRAFRNMPSSFSNSFLVKEATGTDLLWALLLLAVTALAAYGAHEYRWATVSQQIQSFADQHVRPLQERSMQQLQTIFTAHNNALCAPIQPGTVLEPDDGIVNEYEAPWWAPPAHKTKLFGWFCGDRLQTRLEVSNGKVHLLDVASDAVIWESKRSVQVEADRLVKGSKDVPAPWAL